MNTIADPRLLVRHPDRCVSRLRTVSATILLASVAVWGTFSGCSNRDAASREDGGEEAVATDHRIDPTWSIDRARIVFTARRSGTTEGTTEIYLLDRATGDVSPLTGVGTAPDVDGANAARVSPDGTRLAFQVIAGTDYEIHLMDAAGGISTNLTRHPEYDVGATWSPDGTRIAFQSTRGFELGSLGPFPGHVYVVGVDGDGLRQVTREPLTSSLGPSDWSPDGATLSIARVDDGRPDLYLLPVAGGDELRLTSTPDVGEYSARFSSDGRRLAFHAETGEGSQIEIMAIDGDGRRALTSGPGYRYSPSWSPDDRWILFASSLDGDQYDLQAVNVENGEILDLVATPEDERSGDWLPSPPQ